jgi:hypothetical protein
MITITVDVTTEKISDAQWQQFVNGVITDLAAIESVTVNVNHVEGVNDESMYNAGYLKGFAEAITDAAAAVRKLIQPRPIAVSEENENDGIERAAAVIEAFIGITPAPPVDDEEDEEEWGDSLWQSFDEIALSVPDDIDEENDLEGALPAHPTDEDTDFTHRFGD